MSQWYDNDPLFMEEWRVGLRWQEAVAAVLRGLGVPAHLEEDADLRDKDQRERWQKQPDIVIDGIKWTLEVKSRNMEFLTCEDVPYRDIHLVSVHAWKAKSKSRPTTAVVVVSQATGAMVVAPCSVDWTIKHGVYDSVRRIQEDFYAVHRAHLRPLHELAQWLKNKIGEERLDHVQVCEGGGGAG